jgi:hypothetical protein
MAARFTSGREGRIMRRSYFVLAGLIVILALPAYAQPVRTFVSTTGLDANPCSKASPCRNFGAALAAVASGGEVVVLDSGGYGPVTIDKAVSLIATPFHAAIAPTSGSAVTIVAAIEDVVILRNLYLNGQGAGTGIQFDIGAALHVEGCTINGFSDFGIAFVPKDRTARLFVRDSFIRNTGTSRSGLGRGIQVATASPEPSSVDASIDRTRVDRSGSTGIRGEEYARIAVRDSVITNSGIEGLLLTVGDNEILQARLAVDHSVISGNATGVRAVSLFGGPCHVYLSRTTMAHNGLGIEANGGGVNIKVSDSSVIQNNTGLSAVSSGALESRGNNTVQANGTNGAFTGTFAPI